MGKCGKVSNRGTLEKLGKKYSLRDIRRREVEESCALESLILKLEPIFCPETSVRNYHSSLRNNSEERRYQESAISSKATLRQSHQIQL